MAEQVQILFLPFLACLILTGIHVYLGIHVISRKVIFVDLALAQIAALGATVAFLLGYDPRSQGAYYFSLGFAVLAAGVFALTRTRAERVPQEAIIGLAYATASAAAILLADISPHGAEHLHDLLAGSIVWVTPAQILKTAVFYTIIGAFHFFFRERFLMISLHPEQAYAQGVRVRIWDFLFYLSFGVVITSSVQIAGVLLVFCYLVAPAVFAVMFFDDLKRRLITGWVVGTAVSAAGLFFSYDRPSGPTIMVCFAVALILGAVLRAIVLAPSRPRALTAAAAVIVLLVGIGWAFARFGAGHVLSSSGPEAHASALAGSPEHAVGSKTSDLREALRDSHANVRAKAVTDLAATGDHRVVPDLLDALHDQSPAVRESAASALHGLGDPAALPSLKQGLANTDEDEWVRLRLAQAVADLGDPAGIPVLLDLARKADAKLARVEALGTLTRLSGSVGSAAPDPEAPESTALLDKLGRWWQRQGTRLKWDARNRAFRPAP